MEFLFSCSIRVLGRAAPMYYCLFIPTIERSPDQICLHVGTNDLKSAVPNDLADAIVDLARETGGKERCLL